MSYQIIEIDTQSVYGDSMGENLFMDREVKFMNWVGIAIIVAVTLAVVSRQADWVDRITILFAMLAFTLIFRMAVMVRSLSIPATHIGLLIQTTIITWMLIQGSFFFITLFFLLSVQSTFCLSHRQGFVWITAFSLITILGSYLYQGSFGGFLTGFINSAGYWIFGTYGIALIRSHQARRESHRLFSELESAHRQLKDYSTRVEELAVAEERNRLSRDLHDTLGHRLTISIVQLEGAERLCRTDAERASRIIHTIRDQLKNGLTEVRRTVGKLRNSRGSDQSLPQALRDLAAEFRSATGIAVDTEIPKTLPPMPEPTRLAFYRAAQEALTNVQRHAAAKHVWLQFELSTDNGLLRIRDDGRGLGSHQHAGFGLSGLSERARCLDGGFAVQPIETGGVGLEFWLPLKAMADTPKDAYAQGQGHRL